MHRNSLPSHMQAAVAQHWGGSENISIESLPVPTPDSGQVLVKVMAVGLNAADKHLLLGTPYIVRLGNGVRRRKNPQTGRDIAGVVVKIGEGCSRLAVGDAVFGSTNGGLAEYAVAKEDALCLKPEIVSWEQAAAMPISGCTALQALNLAEVAPGSRVLVHGASGGVGTAAVLLAKARGATVIATCSAANRDLVHSLGADTVLDYRTQDPLTAAGPYDCILDIAGTLKNRTTVGALVPGGSLIKIGYSGGNWLGPLTQFLTRYAVNIGTPGRMHMLVASTRRDDLAHLAELAGAGQFAPPIEHIYTLAQTPQAFARLLSGRTAGKSVIRVGEA